MKEKAGPNLSPAVFLDRDGTIIEDRGDLSCPEQVTFYGDTFSALRKLQERFSLFIVTNQSGVAKGALSSSDVERVNEFVISNLAREGIGIAAVYVCPHGRNDGCRCIKPNPYFLLKAKEEHGIDLSQSFVVGDHPHDVEVAVNAGAQGIYVMTGHGGRHLVDIPPHTIVTEGIGEAAQLILLNNGDLRQLTGE